MKEFRHKGSAERAPFQYKMCGLDDIYLVSGYDPVETEYGDGVVIHDMDGLHEAIGLHLVRSKKALNAKEVRFLRHQMNLTQANLAGLLGVTDQTVARWEKDETPITGPAQLLLRVFFLAHLSKVIDIFELAEELREMDSSPSEKQLFAPTDHGWRPIAA